jgi:peptide/nickel transport system permease protein
VFVLFLFCGIFADLLAPYGMNQISPINRLKPPSWQFPFGTDNLGRDMLSRCLYGAQLSVIIGFCAAGLATTLFGRARHRQRLSRRQARPDHAALRRCLDELSGSDHPHRRGGGGRPRACRRSSSRSACCSGIGGSRIIRSAVVSVRENMYVHAAQSIGASTWRILWRTSCPT